MSTNNAPVGAPPSTHASARQSRAVRWAVGVGAATMVAMELPIGLVIPLTLGAGALLGGFTAAGSAEGVESTLGAFQLTFVTIGVMAMLACIRRPQTACF